MGSQDGDRPDVSSIKPVSSLRSRFENLHTSSPTRSLTPAPPVSNQSFLGQSEPDRPRTSLDLPRQSTWNPPTDSLSRGESTVDITLGTPGNGQRRQLTPGRASQRPVSMGMWGSRPSSPPAVTLQTPASPPRPILGDPSRNSAFHSPTRSAIDVPSRRPAGPPMVPLPRSPRSVTPPRTIQAPHEVESVRRPAAPSPLANVKVPPPINRAKKPATPIITNFTPATLGPEKRGRPEEASPFSTPPSSDGSPGHQPPDTAPAVPMATKPAKQGSWPKSASYFPPPPTHHAVEAQRRGSDGATAIRQGHQRSRTRSIDVAPGLDSSDRPERRPVLPSRRNESPATAAGHLTPDAPRTPSEVQRRRPPSPAPPRPSEESKGGLRRSMDSRRPDVSDLLPPPKSSILNGRYHASDLQNTIALGGPSTIHTLQDPVSQSSSRLAAPLPHGNDRASSEPAQTTSHDYPNTSQSNRRPPRSKYGVTQVYPGHETRSIDICGDYACVSGYYTQVWDIRSGRTVLEQDYSEESRVKVTSLVFRPGLKTEQDGQFIWLGFNYGEIQELDIKHKEVVSAKPGAHNHREIISMHRYKNSILSIDDDGKLHLWPPNEDGIPSLGAIPQSFRVSRGHTFSIIIGGILWFAAGKQIHVYNPMVPEDFHVTVQPLVQPGVGDVTTGAYISQDLDKVYFGHSDGRVSIYSTSDIRCIGVVNVSNYKVTSLTGAGHYLWAGFVNGTIHVFDTRQSPWLLKKDWLAHQNPVVKLVTDRSSVMKSGHLQVASLGLDKTIRLWDGFLEDDWLESDMQDRDVEYCDFREIKTVVVTWNAGASTPQSLRFDEKDTNFFRKMLQPDEPPDILVFGFQELVDLEDKKLTAKSFFKSSKKKESSEHEHIGRQYRAWRDYLVRIIDEEIHTESYQLVHTTNMVGLFSCIFIKSSQRDRVQSISSGEIKRGLGGLHGNKGGLIIRFILDDSSLCFANCHLAAGQSQAVNRNEDVTAILEAGPLRGESDLNARVDHFIGGGDGSMIMDHEICILNGDLNYRIDTMGKETVVKAIKAGNLDKLLERDQLLVSKRRNPAFRLRSFKEQPINFAPTYKYDVGTDRYDTSEKNRSPAWCDRILYRGVGKVKALDYRRHEIMVSDHRPVTASFKMRIKSIVPELRRKVWKASEERLEGMRLKLATDANLDYLINVLGVEQNEATRLIKR